MSQCLPYPEILFSNTKTNNGNSNSQAIPPVFTEPILKPNNNRFVLYPIKHHKIWKMYKKALASFWVAEEIDLSHDIDD